MYYNLTITTLSVAVAVLVGSLELLSLAATQLGLHGAFWGWVASLDLNAIGYGVAALFALTWLLSLAIWKVGRIEERWPPGDAPV